MFTKPKHGWVNIKLGDFTERASYLTDILNDCLDAFIYGHEKCMPISIYFDAEGYDFHLISSYYKSYIILTKEETPKLFVIEKDYTDLAWEIINDLEENICEWANWECYKENNIEEEKEKLLQKIEALKKVL